jgi:hypothetical protein
VAALAEFRRDLSRVSAEGREPDPDVARDCETAGASGGAAT